MKLAQKCMCLCVIWTLGLLGIFNMKLMLISFEFIEPEKFPEDNWTSLVNRSQGFSPDKSILTIGFGVCDRNLAQVTSLLKSIIIFGRNAKKVNLVAFAKKENLPRLISKVKNMKLYAKISGLKLEYEIYPAMYPKGSGNEEWEELYRPCFTQKLFLPSILPHIDALIYVNIETLFLADIRDVWGIFSTFDPQQIAALSPQVLLPQKRWLNLRSVAPSYGLNAGVVLLNLTRMRSMNFENRIGPRYRIYQNQINLSDENLFNLFFYFNPTLLRIMDCSFNFRQCQEPGKRCRCHQAEETGIRVMHGTIPDYNAKIEDLSQGVYEIISRFDIEDYDLDELLINLKGLLNNLKKDSKLFSKLSSSVFSPVERYINSLNYSEFAVKI